MAIEPLFKSIVRAHFAIILLLLIAHLLRLLLMPLWDSEVLNWISSIVDLETENSIPNFFSATMLMIASGSAMLIAWLGRSEESEATRPWVIIALCLLFMGVDEGAAIHDRLAVAGQEALQTSGLFFIGWTLPYLVLVLAVTGLTLPMFLRLPRKTLFRLLVAGAIYVLAALGVEMLEGLFLSLNVVPGVSFEEALQRIVLSGEHPVIWDILVFMEETGEMFGVALALRAMLLHLSEHLGLSEIRLTRAAVTETDEAGARPALAGAVK